jgi:triosephosphate isomerase
MLFDAGCTWVILGHSERRSLFGENDEGVNRKILAALKHRLSPIFCLGETLEERVGGRTFDVVQKQLTGGLNYISPDDIKALTIAYEPVWAIGTGKTATPGQAQEVHRFIRKRLGDLYGEEIAASVRIIYGGSVNGTNVKELMAMPDIQGALVGGAGLEVRSFLNIVHYN